jgi:hypothetical protein
MYVTTREHNKKPANLPPETRQATAYVIRRVHIKNQANSPSETRQAMVSPEKCTLKPSQLTL